MTKTVFILSFLLGITAAAADFQIPFRNAAAAIDGKDDEPCWKDLKWNSGFVRNRTGEKAEADTRFKIFHNNKAFYLLAEAMEPAMDKLELKSYSQDGGHHWRNDSLEINFVPDPKVMSFYKFMVDAAGGMDDLRGVDDNTDREVYAYDKNWDGNAVVKTERLANRWRLEMMIPIGAMDIDSKTTAKWRFNIARNRHAGKKESTSWSKITRQSNVTPRQFRQVELENFKVKNFLIETIPPSFRFARKLDGSYEFGTKFDLINRTGSFKRVSIKYILLDPETKKVLYSFHTDKDLPKNYLTKTADTFKGSAPGSYIFSTEILSSGSKPYLIKKMNRPVKLEYQPLMIRLVRPVYRNNIYATMPDKTIEAEIDPGEFAGIPLTAELIGPNGFRDVRNIARSAAKNRIVFDGAKLADGRYTLRISGQKGKEKLISEVKLRKLPCVKGEVWLDARGVMHIDGKPFLPYGFSAGKGKFSRQYTNLWYSYSRYRSVEAARKGISGSFRQSGLRMGVWAFTDLDGKSDWSNTLFTHDKLKGRLTPEQRRKIQDFVPGVSKTEGLLYWVLADEPEGKDHNPRWYEEALELLKELDPYHPAAIIVYGTHGVRTFYTGCDILIPDCFPCFWEDGTTDKGRTCAAEEVKAGAALRPTWVELIACIWPARSGDGKRGVMPDYHDQRQQVYQGVIHNAKGFIYYHYPKTQFYSAGIIGPRVTGLTLQKIKEYVFENTIPDAVSVKTAPQCPDFQTGMKEHKGQFCVIASNTSMKGVKAEFSLRNQFSGTLYTEGAERAVTVRNGRFGDTFRGKETILYFTDKKLAASLIPADRTIKEIADHQAARSNPENLLSRGEFLIIEGTPDRKLLSDPDIPKISASSEQKYGMSKFTGTTLFFLIDGLKDPDNLFYTWTPLKNDRNPWVEFKLPKKHPMNQLVIYTVNGNLIDCDAVVNGKTFSMRNNKSNKITIPLGGDLSDTVRINILKRKNPAGGIEGCLLTEVELY